jgi:hypothetical protein
MLSYLHAIQDIHMCREQDTVGDGSIRGHQVKVVWCHTCHATNKYIRIHYQTPAFLCASHPFYASCPLSHVTLFAVIRQSTSLVHSLTIRYPYLYFGWRFENMGNTWRNAFPTYENLFYCLERLLYFRQHTLQSLCCPSIFAMTITCSEHSISCHIRAL